MNPKCCNQESKLIEQRTFSYFYCEKCRKEVSKDQKSPWSEGLGYDVVLPSYGSSPAQTSHTQFQAFQIGDYLEEMITGALYIVTAVDCALDLYNLRNLDNGLTHTESILRAHTKYIKVSSIKPPSSQQAPGFQLLSWVVVGAKCQRATRSTVYTIYHINGDLITVSNPELGGTTRYSPYMYDNFLKSFSPLP